MLKFFNLLKLIKPPKLNLIIKSLILPYNKVLIPKGFKIL